MTKNVHQVVRAAELTFRGSQSAGGVPVLQLVNLADDRVERTGKCFDRSMSAMALSPNESLAAVATPEGPVVLVDLHAGSAEK